jgi:hypothetical protein
MNMKTMMARMGKRFSVKTVFLVLLLLFFVYILSMYFMRGWYEGMTTEDDKNATVADPDPKKAVAGADPKKDAKEDPKKAPVAETDPKKPAAKDTST